jgi:hypothetical protein
MVGNLLFSRLSGTVLVLDGSNREFLEMVLARFRNSSGHRGIAFAHFVFIADSPGKGAALFESQRHCIIAWTEEILGRIGLLPWRFRSITRKGDQSYLIKERGEFCRQLK